jgi:phage tail sheath protein FI
MGFQVSPGINISEIDLSTVVPAVASTEGAIAGVFRWGPLNERVLVTSEANLATRFGKPFANSTWTNAETFFTAADFLAYGNKLYVARVASNTAYNAGSSNAQISTATAALANSDAAFIARYPGALGNSLKISVCENASNFSSANGGITGISFSLGANTATISDYALLAAGDILRVGSSSIGFQDLVVSVTPTTSTVAFTTKYKLSTALSSATGTRKWGNYKNVNAAPVANNIHVVVIDEDGDVSGTPGTILEVFENVSIVSTAKSESGASNYYKDVINSLSAYIFATGTNQSIVDTAPFTASYTSLTGGTDGTDEANVTLANLGTGYDLFISPEDVDVSLILQGKALHGTDSAGVANYIIDNICEVRKDCMVFVSPSFADVVNNPNGEVDSVLAYRNAINSSSYAFIDSGYKYRYDKYNDVYRYTPLNGDIAGLAVRTDNNRDPWFSPAGYNRGIIKNVVKLAFNPNKAQRDILYVSDINPVITQPGQGTLLFGDKTALGRASAFDRINVRRLFIILEKAIARASRSALFEFNDEFTRAQFKNLVEPFLRDVQGRRGIYDFRVVCDSTNNTGEVIDRNEFIGDIYIKPAKSINFIQLNFVAVRTGVEFEEIVGQF